MQDIETKVIRAEACAHAATQMKQQGFTPDLICGHPGWGELLFLKDVWPKVPLLTYQEFFYNPRGFDYDFDPELQGEPDWTDCARIRTKPPISYSIWKPAAGALPPHTQRSSYPEAWRERISVIHDGIDTDKAAPAKKPRAINLADGTVLKPGEKIVTFVNRNLEPYRGCHTMIRAIPKLQQLVPDAKL